MTKATQGAPSEHARFHPSNAESPVAIVRGGSHGRMRPCRTHPSRLPDYGVRKLPGTETKATQTGIMQSGILQLL